MDQRTGLAGAPAPAGFVKLAKVAWGATAAVLVCGTVRVVLADDATSQPLGARAHVSALHPPDTVTAGELEALRRGLGDNFNPTEALPGTLLVFSGVPYLMVRGAPPAASVQYLDGMEVPALFHLALGPAITHPDLLGGLRFFPGVAPARYGRHTGAVLSASGAPQQPTDPRTELELRLLDAQGFALQPSAGLGLHARIGYPEGMLGLVRSDATLGYWDYHARWEQALDSHDSVEVALLGAADQVGDRGDPSQDIGLQFHRGLLRFRRTLPGFELGAQLVVGHERGRLGTELTATGSRIGPELWVQHTFDAHVRMRLGADMDAKLAHLSRNPEATPRVPNGDVTMPGLEPMPGVDGVPALEPDAVAFLDRAPLARRAARNAAGAYAEFELGSPESVAVSAGLRGDVWIAAGRSQQALDPRLMLRWRAGPQLSLHAGLGSAHQAAASPLPIPGLTDFELDLGLQRAVQSEAGARVSLPGDFELSATGFYHLFSQLVFLELIVDCEGNSDPRVGLARVASAAQPVALCQRNGLPRGSGRAYGLELALSRRVSRRLNGWLSYTLARASATAADGTAFVPQFDVRHILNLVLAYAWGAGFESGVRLNFRSGKPAVNTIFDFAEGHLERLYTRLPSFLRLDLSLAYHWATRWGGLWITLQWLNVTFAREATKRDCRFDGSLAVRCELDYQPAVVLPNAGIRALF